MSGEMRAFLRGAAEGLVVGLTVVTAAIMGAVLALRFVLLPFIAWVFE